ncbi:ADARB1 [Symbiodinium sp. CCMP2456]|nr:ADARB1 [Symbiodinium sp. CCMP2456]
MASADVVVLSVRSAKQRKPRPLQLQKECRIDQCAESQSQEPAEHRQVTQEVTNEMEVKAEVKEELEESESQTVRVAETKLEQKDLKREVKEEASKDAQMKIKTEIKQESSKNIKVEVKEDVKQEVKEEVSKDADMEVKEESNEVVSSRRRMRTKVKAEIKHEVKQEDKKSHRESTGVKQEKVDEDQPVQIKQEGFDQPVPKRRRLSQKSPDVSVPSFESRLTEWAEKCLAFQSSGKTWLPTKPCCPASPFLGLAAAPWQGCVGDKTTSCMQLLGKEQFRELRDFYRENPLHTLFHDNSSPSSERQTETTAGSRPQAHRSSTGNQHRAAECMKMWPWMRDLPTRAWAGNGWLLVEDGMMKLSPTGGGSAMQGLEIFESVGSVPEPGEPSSRAEPRAEEGQVVTKCFRGLERQSGIQGICWHRAKACWRVQWSVPSKPNQQRHFPISKHLKLGLSEAEADEAALQEAKAFRQELVRLGKLKPPKTVTEKDSGSTVRGICYDKSSGAFRVRITDPSTNKKVHGGYFKVKEEAEARARELAKELGLQEELVPVKPLSELPNFEPLGPQKNIKWNLGEQAWKAQCNVSGRKRCMRFRPKDFSAKELEKSWKQAVAWRKQQEKERAQGQQPRKC